MKPDRACGLARARVLYSCCLTSVHSRLYSSGQSKDAGFVTSRGSVGSILAPLQVGVLWLYQSNEPEENSSRLSVSARVDCSSSRFLHEHHNIATVLLSGFSTMRASTNVEFVVYQSEDI